MNCNRSQEETMSKRKVGGFASAVSAAIEAKNADHEFQAYLPPIVPPLTAPIHSNILSIPPYEHEESYTYGIRTTLPEEEKPLSPSRNFIKSEIKVNNITVQPELSPQQPSSFTNEIRNTPEKCSELKITQEHYIYDIILLKQLNLIEKMIVVIVLLSFVAMQVYYHSLHDMFSLGQEAFLSQSRNLFAFLHDKYFSGSAGVKTISSIMLGTALSIFFDAKPVEFDRLCYQYLIIILNPVLKLLKTIVQQLVSIFSILQSIVNLWTKTPRVIKYLTVLLIFMSLARRAVIAVYVNVFVAHGDTIAKAGGFLLIILVFVCLGVAGYGIVYARNALLTRKRVAVEAVTEAVILYLHNLGNPEPISNIHRTLLNLEEKQRTLQPPTNGGNNNRIPGESSGQESNNSKNLALFFSPSGKHPQSSVTTVSPNVVPLSLPVEVWHMSMNKIWPDIVRLVSKDNRVRTTMRHVNGKNEQCWTYIAETHVSVGVVPK